MGHKKSKQGAATDKVREQGLTYDDYTLLPDIEGIRYELSDGVLELMSPAPTPTHQLIGKYIEYVLDESCSSEYIICHSPIDVIFSMKEVRQPDIVAIHRNRASIITRRGIEGPPDLAVEVLSDTSIKRDRGKKSAVYAKYGVLEYWIVTPGSASLEQYVLNGDRYELTEVYVGDDAVTSKSLPCVRFTMSEVMRRMPDLPNA